MKKRSLFRGILLLVLLALVAALAIPASPLYLPELLVPSDLHEGRTVRSWTEDLGSPDAEVRSQAAFALGSIGEPAKKSVPALAALLKEDPDANVRASSAFALSKMGLTAKDAAPALSQALSDDQPLVRINAANALRNLGPEARVAIPALLKGLLEERNEVYVDRFILTVQDAIALAIGKVTAGTDEGVPAMMEALRATKLSPTRKAIVRGLGEIGPAAKQAVPLILEFRADKDRLLQRTVEEALKKIDGAQAAAPVPAGPVLAELPEVDRQYLWEIEHHGNVLSKHGFGRLAAALREGDPSAVARTLADNFTGTDLRDPQPVRTLTAFAVAERMHLADRSPSALDRESFVARLLEFRKPFAATAPQVKISLITLHPQTRGKLEGPWEGTAQLRLAGEHAPGAPAETIISLRFEIAQLTEEALTGPGWLRGAGVLQSSVVRASSYLFAEVAKERGLDPDRLHDNWTTTPLISNTGGVYVCDFNRDGYLDVLVTDVSGVTPVPRPAGRQVRGCDSRLWATRSPAALGSRCGRLGGY